MESTDLNGRKVLVVGIANGHSLVCWVAQHFRSAGDELAMDACEVGRTALFLASGYTSAVTGEVLYMGTEIHVGGKVFH